MEISYPAIGAICSVIAALAIVAGFWGRFSDRLTKAQTASEAAGAKAEGASVSVIANRLEIDRIQRELSDYQIKAAEKFITTAELSNVEQRISSSVEEIKSDIRGVNSRLDRVLDGRESHQK